MPDSSYMVIGHSKFKFLVFSVLIISIVTVDTCEYPPCYGIEHTMCMYPAELNRNVQGCTSKWASAGLNNDERKAILDRHNELRQKIAQGNADGQPQAANMMKLKWNSELEAIAQRFMNSCPASAGHDQCRTMLDGTPVGQNSAFNYFEYMNHPDMGVAMAGAVDLWYDEVKSMTPNIVNDFSQAQPIFYQIGHYSQLAWATTTMVGCGVVLHDPENEVYQTYVMNCNYAPAGNYMDPGTPVYIVGEPCSQCPARTHCSKQYPGLCTDETDEEDTGIGSVSCGSIKGSLGFVAITLFLACAQYYCFRDKTIILFV